MVHSPGFFSSENSKYFSLRVRLFCMALVEQLGDGSWCTQYVQLAAIWHWYLSGCIYITVFNFILSVHSFLFFSFFNLVSMN